MTSIKISRTATIFIASILLYACGGDSEWEKAKKEDTVYPAEKISIHTSGTGLDRSIVWINEAYKDYAFKKECGHLVLASFYNTDPKVNQGIYKDSLGIARLLVKEFRKTGVAHFVGQDYSQGILNVCIYHEDDMNPLGVMGDFFYPNESMIKEDKDWTTYQYLLSNLKVNIPSLFDAN